MMQYTDALHLDISGAIEKAVTAYEDVIQTPDAPLDAWINLACIYWESTDFGFNTAMKLPREFVEMAGNKMWEILDQAESKFGKNPEILFWRMYFRFTTLGEPPFAEQCLELVAYPECSLVPFFHLYDQTRDSIYIQKVKLLYEDASASKTTKNRYIISIIESTA